MTMPTSQQPDAEIMNQHFCKQNSANHRNSWARNPNGQSLAHEKLILFLPQKNSMNIHTPWFLAHMFIQTFSRQHNWREVEPFKRLWGMRAILGMTAQHIFNKFGIQIQVSNLASTFPMKLNSKKLKMFQTSCITEPFQETSDHRSPWKRLRTQGATWIRSETRPGSE